MKREIKLVGISYSQSQMGSYSVVLSEINGQRKLPVIVRTNDAQVIMMRAENMSAPKPLTQDIVKGLTDAFNISCDEIYIYQIAEGIFYTRASFSDGIDDTQIEISVGEAVSMSILYGCPLYVSEEILASCGIYMDEDGVVLDADTSLTPSDKKEPIMSIEDLESMLKGALDNEDYEMAAEIRDKINLEKSKKK